MGKDGAGMDRANGTAGFVGSWDCSGHGSRIVLSWSLSPPTPYGNSPQGMEEEKGKYWILSVPAVLCDLP